MTTLSSYSKQIMICFREIRALSAEQKRAVAQLVVTTTEIAVETHPTFGATTLFDDEVAVCADPACIKTLHRSVMCVYKLSDWSCLTSTNFTYVRVRAVDGVRVGGERYIVAEIVLGHVFRTGFALVAMREDFVITILTLQEADCQDTPRGRRPDCMPAAQ